MKLIIPFFVALLFISCENKETELLQSSLTTHGSKLLNKSKVSFDFRDHHYDFIIDEGIYSYTRSKTDTLGNITLDILTNESFQRIVNNKNVELHDTLVAAYSNSVNSVAYFFLLPKTLEDPAAQLEKLDPITINGKSYETLKVTFSQDGGGEDFQDEFRYWINQESKEIDFLAYNYQTDGGGIRFREAFNKRRINGVLVTDYRNYGFESLDYDIDNMPKLWEENKIPLLSTIENKNVEIGIN